MTLALSGVNTMLFRSEQVENSGEALGSKAGLCDADYNGCNKQKTILSLGVHTQ